MGKKYKNGNVNAGVMASILNLLSLMNHLNIHYYVFSGTLTDQPVWLGGCLQFVPGTLESSLGDPFNVNMPDIKFRRLFIRNGQF
jgi:hypothetical protein